MWCQDGFGHSQKLATWHSVVGAFEKKMDAVLWFTTTKWTVIKGYEVVPFSVCVQSTKTHPHTCMMQ